MNRKSLTIAIVMFVCCSLVSFIIGYSIPHGAQDNGVESSKPNNKETAKYAGLYITQTNTNGRAKLYLNNDNTCTYDEAELPKEHFQGCTWIVEGKKLILHRTGSLVNYFQTKQECEDFVKNVEGHLEWHIEELKEGDLNYPNHAYAAYINEDLLYDILDDGSLSLGNDIYIKRSSL